MSTQALDLANIQAFVGRELGASRWMTLDQRRIDEFADCTDDRQWIHVDAERARRESPLGTTIAHGYLTLAMIAPSTFEVLVEPAGIAQALNYGLDRVRFLAPVRSGARVRNRIKLIAAEPKGDGRFLLTTENTIEIENEPKPALIAHVLVLAMRRRDRGAGGGVVTARRDDERGADEPDALAGRAAEGMLGPNPFIGLRPEDIAETVRLIGAQAVKQPGVVLEQEAAFARDLISALCGNADLAPEKGDKRFADSAWQWNPFYRTYLQGYLAWSRALGGFVDKAAVDERTRERIRYVVSLATEALAPTNTLLGNPAALKKMIDSGGGSVLAGLKQMLGDLMTNRGMPAQIDKQAFRVGENLAQSPGAVVFANEVLELIQYAPATAEVHARPHLIVPPQINKFYVFDLSPGKSIVQHLVRSGFRVFAVSWRNPTADQGDWDMDTYAGALLEAIAAVREITGSPDVNLHAACSGAMTVSALLGHLAARGERPVHAATLMVAVLGTNEGSQLGLFATPRDDRRREARFRRQGRARRPGHGTRVRVAAPQRPRLELLGQQLPHGAAAAGVRRAVLEQRHHAAAGAVPRRNCSTSSPATCCGSRVRSTCSARRSTSGGSNARSSCSPASPTTSRRGRRCTSSRGRSAGRASSC